MVPFRVLLPLLLAVSSVHAAPRWPAFILEVPPNVPDIFIADAGNAVIYRYEQKSGVVRLGGKSYMSIGQYGVGKKASGDRKTPLGIYFVIDHLDTSRLHEKYGVMAFPLDYPNVRDRQFGRAGNGIWVHGVQQGAGPRPPFDTDGCLALPNDDLDRLRRNFVPLITPVIIAREIKWQSEETRERIRDELRTLVERWASSYAAKDQEEHLSLYADEFSYRGLSRDEWATFRAQSLPGSPRSETVVGDLLLLADPEEVELYLSRFRMLTVAGQDRHATTKRLYWQRGSDGVLRIVAEDNG
ncbi:MAG TPA: L,D-transpeptidase family protein [Woeseiaceae bacterium]|nr:L,D-transpeptidase family protein [Woeseiaceae bacterium]